jgi:hypothetical protein
MKTEEGKLKHQIKVHLTKLGAYFFCPVQTGYGATTLDFLVCLNGKFLAIETKAKGKKPTPRQELVLKQIKKAGGITFWCDSFDDYLLQMEYYDVLS